jgi:NAD(P)-dependent dehydrogenase (short-subunit alcohol dehydrogenase family)
MVKKMGLFNEKVVIITGAGRGIGKAHAHGFAKEGAKVVVNDLGTELDGSGFTHTIADTVVEEIKIQGGEAVANYDSVVTLEGANSIIQTAIDTYGQIDVLINNAGILRDKSILKMEEEMWDLVISVHLRGTFTCTQAAARIMKNQQRGGSIINTTSFSGIIGNFGQSNYGAAKAGIVGFTKVAAIELERYGINVNAIAPMAQTRMKSPIVTESMTPETIAPVVLFLASENAKKITGKIIGIHGSKIFEYQTSIFNEGVEKEYGESWTVDEISARFDEITSRV